EWRQQLLVLALITVAVAATIIGAAVATNTPPPANAGFGTAHYMATFQAPNPHLASQVATLRHPFGPGDVIQNPTAAIPRSPHIRAPRPSAARSVSRCSRWSPGTSRPGRARWP